MNGIQKVYIKKFRNELMFDYVVEFVYDLY